MKNTIMSILIGFIASIAVLIIIKVLEYLLEFNLPEFMAGWISGFMYQLFSMVSKSELDKL